MADKIQFTREQIEDKLLALKREAGYKGTMRPLDVRSMFTYGTRQMIAATGGTGLDSLEAAALLVLAVEYMDAAALVNRERSIAVQAAMGMDIVMEYPEATE